MVVRREETRLAVSASRAEGEKGNARERDRARGDRKIRVAIARDVVVARGYRARAGARARATAFALAMRNTREPWTRRTSSFSTGALGAALTAGADLEPPPTEGAEMEGSENEGSPAARFLVFFSGVGAFFFVWSSANCAAASALASACLSAIWPSSFIASAGCASMVSASAPATAEDLAWSAEDALATVCVRTFLGAATRAATTGVATRDIIASLKSV